MTGEPWIPAESVSVALPPDMLPSSVEVETVGDPVVIPLEKTITPMSEPVAVSKTVVGKTVQVSERADQRSTVRGVANLVDVRSQSTPALFWVSPTP